MNGVKEKEHKPGRGSERVYRSYNFHSILETKQPFHRGYRTDTTKNGGTGSIGQIRFVEKRVKGSLRIEKDK